MNIFIYLYIHLRIHIYTHTFACKSAEVNAPTQTHTHTCTHTRTCLQLDISTKATEEWTTPCAQCRTAGKARPWQKDLAQIQQELSQQIQVDWEEHPAKSTPKPQVPNTAGVRLNLKVGPAARFYF